MSGQKHSDTTWGEGDRVITNYGPGVVTAEQPASYQRRTGWTVGVKLDKRPPRSKAAVMFFDPIELEPEADK